LISRIGQFLNFAPRGEFCPQGELFTPLFIPTGEHPIMFIRTNGWTEGLHPRGLNFTPRGQLHPWWPTYSRGGQSYKIGLWKRKLLYIVSGFVTLFWIAKHKVHD
jgi:hypothetical protein